MTGARHGSGVRLRVFATVATIALAMMVVAVTVALILLTTSLHRTNVVLRHSVGGVRLADEVALDLLIHARARDHVVRASLENDLRRKLVDSRQHATSPDLHTALDEASVQAQQYLASQHDPAISQEDRDRMLESAYEALRTLVRVNVAQADAAQQEAARWDELADTIGISACLVMLIVLIAVLWWLERAVVRPLLQLAGAMQRFEKGDLDVRIDENGVAELRQIAARFNTIAATLTRQQRTRLTYLAGIAHDLRSPLATLQMSTALFEREGTIHSEHELRHLVSIIRRQVVRLNRMVGDLLDTTRIEAGQLAFTMAEHDLRAVVRTVVELFEGASPLHEIRVALADEPLPVRCDALRIEQTLSNLVSNAIKYSPRGGEVRIRGYADAGRAVLEVSDHGIGIAEDDLAHIWEPFRRTGASTELIPGVGLGLSIAKRIIEAHGGEITVKSTPGVGSTFSVVLPLSGDRGGAGASRPLAEH